MRLISKINVTIILLLKKTKIYNKVSVKIMYFYKKYENINIFNYLN